MTRVAPPQFRGSSFIRLLVVACGVFCGVTLAAQPLWAPINEAAISSSRAKAATVKAYQTMALNQDALTALLAQAPMEFSTDANASPPTIELPMPNGTLARFSFVESPIMEPGLAQKFPNIKTYRAQGIDDPSASARFDWTPLGFHAMVLSSAGTVVIDPYSPGATSKSADLSRPYMSYWKHDAVRATTPFTCAVHGTIGTLSTAKSAGVALIRPAVSSGTQLRTYRMALAATNEYAVAVGGNTVAGTLAAQTVVMNRVNGIFERDAAVRMILVNNNNLILYAGNNSSCGGACTAANDPFTNNNPDAMLGENQAKLDAVIGSANYDIGHVFSTSGSGIAALGAACSSTVKAQGVTGLTSPIGDVFAVDMVAHEIGHQFSATHSFNATGGNCDAREATSAHEPGSGVTIMGYASACTTQNLQYTSIETFHSKSLEQIIAYSQTGDGNACAAITANGNTPPAVAGPGNFTIPKGTPFALTAVATDVNGDAITYDWQQYDLGAAATTLPNTDADGTPRPLFRNYLPTTSGTRTFPSLQYILNNANVPPASYDCSFGTLCLTGELLPAIARTMIFRVVARDNRAGGGGINTADSQVTVDGASGPFVVTAPNTAITVAGGNAFNVTWNAAGTAATPVNAGQVKISLSTNGGISFPTVLAASTANTGAATVTMPNTASTTARIKVEAVGNIFFDVSDANFTITATATGPTLDVDASVTATKYDAATDGALVLRYMLGLRGTALTAGGVVGGTATRVDPDAIKTYLDGLGLALDIDGDGAVTPMRDGLLILRYMLNLRGAALISGIANPVGTRTVNGTIEQHLGTLMP